MNRVDVIVEQLKQGRALGISDGQLYGFDVVELADEVMRLRSQLATARREGLEEAAKVADRYAERQRYNAQQAARSSTPATMRGSRWSGGANE